MQLSESAPPASAAASVERAIDGLTSPPASSMRTKRRRAAKRSLAPRRCRSRPRPRRGIGSATRARYDWQDVEIFRPIPEAATRAPAERAARRRSRRLRPPVGATTRRPSAEPRARERGVIVSDLRAARRSIAACRSDLGRALERSLQSAAARPRAGPERGVRLRPRGRRPRRADPVRPSRRRRR